MLRLATILLYLKGEKKAFPLFPLVTVLYNRNANPPFAFANFHMFRDGITSMAARQRMATRRSHWTCITAFVVSLKQVGVLP
ncbi:hypothetical protein LSAT2_000178 [Lamellibrachia satsuma]|nr:hypothetical protein LSAT2_000178 [Lamellibrachia satsuma]